MQSHDSLTPLLAARQSEMVTVVREDTWWNAEIPEALLLLIRTALVFGCALCLMAQSDDSPAQSEDEYGGPAILSRGELPRSGNAAPIAFRPYIGISGIYDSGLLPVSVNSNGQIPSPGLYGVEANLGLYGYHAWKQTTLGLDYRGDFRHYSKKSYFDGSDNILSLVLTHRPGKRWIFTLRNSAGIYSQNYFLMSLGYEYYNYPQLPQNDIYDSRVIFLGTTGDLIYRMTARLSFDVGAEGNLIRRQSTALYGLTAGSAHGDLQYRISRHTTIGADYRFMHYDFTRGFGNSNIHSVGLTYATQLTRHLQFSARAGGARVDSLTLAAVPIAPAIAAILGQSYGVQAAHFLSYAPDITARLAYSLRRSQFGVNYTDSVNPGNGVYLTSRMESAGAGYSYTGIRYWNFGLNANYSRLSALMQTLGTFASYGGGGGVTRELGKGFHAVARLDVLHYAVAANYFIHNEYRATLGFSWSPGDLPLSLW
jgi:hypothetical protein